MTSEPFLASYPGCGGYRTRATTQPEHCGGQPLYAGLVWYPYPVPRVLWWAFACRLHVTHLQAVRELLERDRAELEQRRGRWQTAEEGHEPWVTEQPLARGSEGRRLLERALAASPTRP